MRSWRPVKLPDKGRPVAFFETSEQLAALVAYEERTGTECRLMAVTAEADYAAEARGLQYQVIEDFYSDAALMELGVRNLAKLESLCLRMDRHLHTSLGGVSTPEAVSTLPQLYYLKALVDALLHRSLTVTAALAGTRPSCVISFAVPAPPRDITAFLLSNRLTSRMVPLLARRLGIRSVVLSTGRRGPTRGRKNVRTMLSEVSGVRRLHVAVRRTGLRLAHMLARGDASVSFVEKVPLDHPILICRLDDDPITNEVAAAWERVYPGCHVSPEHVLRAVELAEGRDLDRVWAGARRACAKAWHDISRDPEVASFFRIGLLDLYPLAIPFLKRLVSSIPDTLRAAEAFKRGLARLPSSVVLLSSGGQHLGLAAQSAGRPAVVVQHGGGYGYLDLPIVEYLEMYGGSHFFCYGQGTAELLARPSRHVPRRAESNRAVPVAVGSPILDAVMKREVTGRTGTSPNASGRTVVYVLTNLGGDRRYFSYHMYPDIWFWRLQRRVIETCVQFSDVQLIVKLYPTDDVRSDLTRNPVVDWLSQVQPRRCQVVSDRPFIELFSVADLFIMDWPATTLLEALTTTKPVITFADSRWVRFEPRAKSLLRERAIFSESGEQFLKDIAGGLAERKSAPVNEVNDAFLSAYGTHLNDGRSAERAVQALHRLATAPGQPQGRPVQEPDRHSSAGVN